jgi:hypothetical protein
MPPPPPKTKQRDQGQTFCFVRTPPTTTEKRAKNCACFWAAKSQAKNINSALCARHRPPPKTGEIVGKCLVFFALKLVQNKVHIKYKICANMQA